MILLSRSQLRIVAYLSALVVLFMAFSSVIMNDLEASLTAQSYVHVWKNTSTQSDMFSETSKDALETLGTFRGINEQNTETLGMYFGTVSPRVTRAEDESLNPVQPFSTSCGNGTILVVLVASDPKRFDRRSTIRQTWGNCKRFMTLLSAMRSRWSEVMEGKDPVRVVFLLGRRSDSRLQSAVDKEALVHRDIVLGNFQDHYRNLTLKTLVGLKWACCNCKSARYVLKTDDDVFVNIFKLMKWLVKSPRRKLYTGTCKGGSPVIRNPAHKWYVSYEEYPHQTYPNYCKGGGYLISMDVLRDVVRMSNGRGRFPMEDIHVGLIARELGIVPVNDAKRFNLAFSKRRLKRATSCDLDQLFLAHPAEPASLVQMQTMVQKARKECKSTASKFSLFWNSKTRSSFSSFFKGTIF